MYSVFKSILQNISINELTNCRDIFEIKEFLQEFGYTLNFEEINQFKEFLNAKPKKDSAPGVLSLSELYDVAGGIKGVIIHADGRRKFFEVPIEASHFKSLPKLTENSTEAGIVKVYLKCIAKKLVEKKPTEDLERDSTFQSCLRGVSVYDFTLDGNVYHIQANSFGFRYTLFDLFNRNPEYLKKYLEKGEDKKQLDSSNEENSHHLNSLARSVTPPTAYAERDDECTDLSKSDSHLLHAGTNDSGSAGSRTRFNRILSMGDRRKNPQISDIISDIDYQFNFDKITEDMLKSMGGEFLVLQEPSSEFGKGYYQANMYDIKGILEILKKSHSKDNFQVLTGMLNSTEITTEQKNQIFNVVRDNSEKDDIFKFFNQNLNHINDASQEIKQLYADLKSEHIKHQISKIATTITTTSIVTIGMVALILLAIDKAEGDPLDL